MRVRAEVTRIGRPERAARSARRRRRAVPGRGIPVEAHAEAEAAPPAPAGLPRWRAAADTRARSPTARASPCAPTWRRRSTGWPPPRRTRGSPWSSTPPTDPTPSRRSSSLSTRIPAGWRRRGQSLHRCATELDLGPPAAYGMAGRATRHGSGSSGATPGRHGTSATRGARPRAPRPANAVGQSPGRRQRRGGGPAGLRARPVSRPDPSRGGALERLRRAARRPADGRVQLQPLRRLGRRCAGDRPVHARDRARLWPSRPVRRAGGDRRPGPPDVRPPAPVRLRVARARRLQRGPRAGGRLPLRARRSPRPRPTSPGSSACWAAPASWLAPTLEVRLVD